MKIAIHNLSNRHATGVLLALSLLLVFAGCSHTPTAPGGGQPAATTAADPW